jgi:predicted PurR-regulated permease PerM
VSLNRFYVFTLIMLSLILGFLCYLVLRPFLTPLVWAAVLSIVFYPLYAFLIRHLRWKSVSAAVTLAIILVIIIGPVSYLSVLLVSEIQHLGTIIDKGEPASLQKVLENPNVVWVMDRVKVIFGIEGKDIGAIVSDNLSAMVKQLVGQITKGVRNVVSVFLNFVFMAFSIFFFLRDGPGFIKRLRDYLPFSEEQKDRLEFQVKGMVVSVIFGGVVVAVVQGLMGGTAFHFLGIKTPVIWGTAIAIMSFVPVLGTFSIWGPATVYLFLKGAIAKSFILLIVGTFGISMVDNILKPVIIGERTKMPTLVIFFSVLGGIKVFGPIGIIMGPLVVVLFISVFEIFRNIEGGSHA